MSHFWTICSNSIAFGSEPPWSTITVRTSALSFKSRSNPPLRLQILPSCCNCRFENHVVYKSRIWVNVLRSVSTMFNVSTQHAIKSCFCCFLCDVMWKCTPGSVTDHTRCNNHVSDLGSVEEVKQEFSSQILDLKLKVYINWLDDLNLFTSCGDYIPYVSLPQLHPERATITSLNESRHVSRTAHVNPSGLPNSLICLVHKFRKKVPILVQFWKFFNCRLCRRLIHQVGYTQYMGRPTWKIIKCGNIFSYVSNITVLFCERGS